MILSMKDIAAFRALGHPREDFQFSAMMDKNAHEILDILTLQDFLNQNVSLSRYGALRHIGFTPIAIKGDRRHESITYNEDELSVDINIQLDYRLLKEATTKPEATSLLARYFLAAIPAFAEIPVPNFQISAFRKDIAGLFQEQGWLNAALPNISSPSVYLVWMSDFHTGPSNGKLYRFFARKIALKEWYDAIHIKGFIEWLNRRIDLSNYSSDVEEFYLTFLADEVDEHTSPPDSTWFRADRELHLSIPLGFSNFDKLSLLDALVEALPEIDRWDIAGFNWERLLEDCLTMR